MPVCTNHEQIVIFEMQVWQLRLLESSSSIFHVVMAWFLDSLMMLFCNVEIKCLYRMRCIHIYRIVRCMLTRQIVSRWHERIKGQNSVPFLPEEYIISFLARISIVMG